MLRKVLKLILPVITFLILSIWNKGWMSFLLIPYGGLLIILTIGILLLFRYVGKREPSVVKKAYYETLLLFNLIALVSPGLTDVKESSSAFTFVIVDEGSTLYNISEKATTLALVLLFVITLVNIVKLVKAKRVK